MRIMSPSFHHWHLIQFGSSTQFLALNTQKDGDILCRSYLSWAIAITFLYKWSTVRPPLGQSLGGSLVAYLLTDNLLSAHMLFIPHSKSARLSWTQWLSIIRGACQGLENVPVPPAPCLPCFWASSECLCEGSEAQWQQGQGVQGKKSSGTVSLSGTKLALVCTLVSILRYLYVDDTRGCKISLVSLSTCHRDKLELIPRKNLLNFCIII